MMCTDVWQEVALGVTGTAGLVRRVAGVAACHPGVPVQAALSWRAGGGPLGLVSVSAGPCYVPAC